MKNKSNLVKQLAIVLIGCVICLVIQGCRSDDEIVMPKEIEGEINIIYQDIVRGDTLNEELTYEFLTTNSDIGSLKIESFISAGNLYSTCYYIDEDKKWAVASEFYINLRDEYRTGVNTLVENEAEFAKQKFKNNQINIIERTLDAIPKLLIEKIGNESYSRESSLAVFLHLGVFKAARRSNSDNSEKCNCGNLQTYINKESPFFCFEDKVVNVDEVYKLLYKVSENHLFANKQFIPNKTFEYLKQRQGEFISVSVIDELYVSEFRHFFDKTLTQQERLSIMGEDNLFSDIKIRMKSGSESGGSGNPIDPECYLYGASSGGDCGCCGNYSGRCWYCNLACYVHDNQCENCTLRWYCLPGCVPTPC
ncbi:MAG: hypothetical protein ACK5L5_05470 [Bacteroidales bacterium]